jgi:hypothetical protein
MSTDERAVVDEGAVSTADEEGGAIRWEGNLSQSVRSESTR